MMWLILIIIVVCLIIKATNDSERRKLLDEILTELHLENIHLLLTEYDDKIIVKSRAGLNNYNDLKYFKENDALDKVKRILENRKKIKLQLQAFIEDNNYEERSQYQYVKNILLNYIRLADDYRIRVIYITSAGNNRGEVNIHINGTRIVELINHPELLMTKGEFNKLIKEKNKKELDSKKHAFYNRVNEIIDFTNYSKDKLIVKEKVRFLDELMQKLFDKTVNHIQKVSKIDSDEWEMLENYILTVDKQIKKIVKDDKRISDYYKSDDFEKIKETCNLLTQSKREFNEYINEKAQSITSLFGTRIVRNETQHEDVFNYIRTYNKSITPFTAEVSSNVFGSAENNPIDYIIKYFYPNKNQYVEQIEKLKLLIEELETLKEAKIIIDNYKKEYEKYIQNVPSYVLDNDEKGVYSRLGLAIIDENVLNVEYKFVYTSDGGMAQRSFTIPMNEENITELINQLESKLSLKTLAKEQRALMTIKLRTKIKERDNFTCCKCGNSIHKEPNLLLEIDHIIPISKGGLTKEDNLQTLCWKCNRNKGARIEF